MFSSFASTAHAQDTEPNDTCVDATDLGTIASARFIDGALQQGDADFFRFSVDRAVNLSAMFPQQFGFAVFDGLCRRIVTVRIEQFGNLGADPGTYVIGLGDPSGLNSGAYRLAVELAP